MDCFKINREEFKTWINALRSGEYKQGTGHLQSGIGYCCLGVACEVLIPKEKQLLDGNDMLAGSFPNHQINSPEWLREINYEVEKFTKITLGVYNDDKNYTFEMIAELLENTFPEGSEYFQN